MVGDGRDGGDEEAERQASVAGEVGENTSEVGTSRDAADRKGRRYNVKRRGILADLLSNQRLVSVTGERRLHGPREGQPKRLGRLCQRDILGSLLRLVG